MLNPNHSTSVINPVFNCFPCTTVCIVYWRQTSRYGRRESSVRIGSHDIGISVLVADIEDSAILSMDFLSDINEKIDLGQ